MRIRALFLVTGSVLSVGAQFLAAQSIDSGAATRALDAFIAASQGFGA